VVEFPAQTLRAAVDESIAANRSLLPGIDAGLVAAARAVADRVDDAIAVCDGTELTKALYLIPHVNNLLREMLATPAARAAAKLSEVKPGGKLSAIRGGKSA
jgi:ATP-dependent protease Clp ATPase subunit